MSNKTKLQLETELKAARAQITQIESELNEARQKLSTQMKAQERLQQLLDILPIGISALDAERKLRFQNSALSQILGLDAQALQSGAYKNRTYLAADGSPLPVERLASVQAIRTGQAVYDVETGIIKEDGDAIWTSVSAVPVDFPDWKTVIVTTNITERKQAEEKFFSAFHRSPAALTITRIADGKFTDANESFLRIFEFTREEVIGHTSTELNMLTPEAHSALIERQLATGGLQNAELATRSKSGKTIHILFSSSPTFINNEPHYITTMIDITERKRSEERLADSESRFATIFENSPVAISISNLSDGEITDANAAFVNLYGFSREQILGRTTAELGIWAIPADHQRFIEQLRNGDSVRNFETIARVQAGSERHVLVSGVKVEINGRPSLVAQIQDITERKHAEQTRQESQRKLQLFVEYSPAAIAMFDREMRYIAASRRYAIDYHLPTTELVGRCHYEIFPEISDQWKEIHRRCLAGAIETAEADPFPRADGTLDWVRWEIHPWYESNEKIGGIILFSEVITDRIRLEQERAKLTERLDLATRSARMGIWDWDIQKNELIWDEQMYALYGLKPGGFAGAYEAWLHGVHPDDRDSSNRESEAAVRGHREYNTDFRVLWPDGSVHWLKATGQVFRDRDGVPLRMVGVNYDITERKQSEEELHESRELFQKLFDLSPVAYSLSRVADNQILDINPTCERLFGYSKEEIVGRRVDDLDYWLDPHELQKATEHFRRNGELRDFEFAYKTRSGTIGWAISYANLIEQGAEKYILAEFVEVSKRKRAEEELRASQQILQDIIDNTPALVYTFDKDGRFLLINRQLEKFFGLTTQQMVGRNRSDFVSDEFAKQHRDHDLEIFNSGQGKIFEEENMEPDGRHVYLTTKFPLFDASGDVYAVCGISTDMTARKQMEEELRRSNAELEQFAYIASHDLQEPLRAVAGMVQLLQKRYQGQLDARADEYISHAVDAAGRMQSLIQALLSYSRVERRNQPIESVDAGKSLTAALKNLDFSIQESHAVVTHDTLPTVHADPMQLTQLFQNLIGNAIKFRGDKEPQIHIFATRLTDAWQFAVQDNGIGIEPQYFERIFLIFQRLHTRSEYSGTGIGLALCKKIVERHSGRIWVESEPGQGSTFYFTLPTRSQ